MSDTVKLIIEIPKEMHEQIKDGYVPLGISKYLKNGTPLEEELHREKEQAYYLGYEDGRKQKVLRILNNIGKAESEDEK